MKDLKEFKIKLYFSQIAAMTKSTFKLLVKNSCESTSFSSLMKERENLSKGQEITYDSLKIQRYLTHDSRLSIESMRRIYHVRCREIQVKSNYPSSFSDTKCPFSDCEKQDTQTHLFESYCFSEQKEIMNINNAQYEDIFGCDIEAKVNVVQIIFSKLENRRKFLSNEGIPADPRGETISFKLGIQKANQKYKRNKRINNTRGC